VLTTPLDRSNLGEGFDGGVRKTPPPPEGFYGSNQEKMSGINEKTHSDTSVRGDEHDQE
jgi:hypothetical protein